MKELFPDSKIVASEALQCPTLLQNGFGAHRIEELPDAALLGGAPCKQVGYLRHDSHQG